MTDLQPFTTEREWTADGIPVLSAAVSVPQPVPCSDRLSRRFFRYYQLQSRAYLKYCERDLFPQATAACRAALEVSAPLPLFRAELTYRITFHDSHFFRDHPKDNRNKLLEITRITCLYDHQCHDFHRFPACMDT